jgi:hypothetical protein
MGELGTAALFVRPDDRRRIHARGGQTAIAAVRQVRPSTIASKSEIASKSDPPTVQVLKVLKVLVSRPNGQISASSEEAGKPGLSEESRAKKR